MQERRTIASVGKIVSFSPWEDLFFGFVIILALVLLVTVVRRLALVAVVCWVYGSAGYDGGIRVYFVGKTPWFSNGERVPDSVANVGTLGAFVVSLFIAYILLFSVRWVYRRLSSKG